MSFITKHFARIIITFILLFASITPSYAELRSVPARSEPYKQYDLYDVDAFTGSVGYSYPIKLPPGTNGLTPELTY